MCLVKCNRTSIIQFQVAGSLSLLAIVQSLFSISEMSFPYQQKQQCHTVSEGQTLDEFLAACHRSPDWSRY